MGYVTLKKEAEATLEDRRSVFVAKARPVQTEQEALDFLNAIRAEDRTATHNVFAYRLRERNFSRYSDDGEPSGTAGLPVLDVLERPGITDAVIVVTRWFGGTLLGTGGLVRAYSGAARLAVEAAGTVHMELAGRYALNCAYGDYERILRAASDCGVNVEGSEFTDCVRMTLTAMDGPAEAFGAALRELTRGSGSLELLEKGFLPVD